MKKELILLGILISIVFAGCVDQNPEEYYLEGVLQYDAGNYTESIDLFEKAIQLDPEESKYWLMKGKALYNLERYEEAVDCYNYVINVIEDEYNKDVWAAKADALRYIEGKEVEAEIAEARAK
ncbi:tetratricopeptide repeat protein [Methanococcus maripaludis]|uniref:Tetratricopeptide (TPR) repeat protein n=1 Tax=Methanococcus maripaludis TaxID=39152 RepID=A0A2L1CCK9_METMI|nr:tetratricopeptide repeat protein [Methanococcus maripaludis]AVB77074.1 Tetratricopeptide repeat protein [Methanococcus maripaludis]MBA2863585.1 tetratricopeptide (TPR) repeat protein [Methanococcus maripaludis]MBB6496409.1 tetratricopeptide (TPR) repeat protein [Methanococcus maripaludis]